MHDPHATAAPDDLGAAPPLDEALSMLETRLGIAADGQANPLRLRRLVNAVEQMQLDLREAQAAVQAKVDLLAALSHQVRTAMNGVMGMTELALDTEVDDEQRDYLESARAATRSLLAFLGEVLELSQIESQALELAQESFSLPLLLKTVCRGFAKPAMARGTKLAYKIRPGVPPRLVGDPARLRQVLQTLVANALRLTHAGQVEVEARTYVPEHPATVAGEPQRVHLLFIVRDTGVGIPLERAVTIFDSIARPETPAGQGATGAMGATGETAAPRAWGTVIPEGGLGLPISKRLLKLMGGHIWVDSGEGEGSWFCFTAQFGRDDTPPPPPPAGMSED